MLVSLCAYFSENYKQDYEKLEELLKTLPNRTTHEVMVRFIKLLYAFRCAFSILLRSSLLILPLIPVLVQCVWASRPFAVGSCGRAGWISLHESRFHVIQ